MNKTGNNLESIQQMNRTLILKLLQQNKLCSRAKLAKQSGLKQATITNIINDFLEWGIVIENGFLEGKKGRRSIGVSINDERFFVIGVRLTRHFYNIGLFNIIGKEIYQYKSEKIVGLSPDVVLKKIKDDLKSIIKTEKEKNIISIGVAVPGPYYSREGKIELITDFPGWRKISIKEKIQKDFDIPISIDHDANAGVLAECTLSGKSYEGNTIVYLAVGQGIGCGIYHNNEIMKGSQGIAGEIGHSSIMCNGPYCECGNRGCLTLYASSIAFLNKALDERKKCSSKDTILPNKFDFYELVEAVRNKDEFAYRIFKEVMDCLSIGIINIICAYNPSLIIIGDEVSDIGQPIIDELKSRLGKLALKRAIDQTELRLTSFDKDPAYFGAAALAIDYAFSTPTLFIK